MAQRFHWSTSTSVCNVLSLGTNAAATLTNSRRVLRGSAAHLQHDRRTRTILLVLPFSEPCGQERDPDLAEWWPWLLFPGRPRAGEWTFPLAIWHIQARQESLDLGKPYQCSLGRAVRSVHPCAKLYCNS